MPRPRFFKLEQEKQTNILQAASEEFTEKGFEAASLNRIIAKAGLSKGAMYYYFDDKIDLYITVIRDAHKDIGSVIGSLGPVQNVEQFWSEVALLMERVVHFSSKNSAAIELGKTLINQQLMEHPEIKKLMSEMFEYTSDVLRIGQQVKAVRDDLPFELLVNLVWSIGEAYDRWFMAHWKNFETAEIENFYEILVRMFQKMMGPEK